MNMLNDYGKLIVIIIAMVGGFVMVLTGAVAHEPSLVTPGVGVVMAALGYVTGNGVLASRGQAPSPVIVPSDRKVRRRLAEVAVQELDDLDTYDAAEVERLARLEET